MAKRGKKQWTFGSKISLEQDSNLRKIVEFYLWACPVEGASVRGKTFEEYGWKGATFKTLQAKMRNGGSFPSKSLGNWLNPSPAKLKNELRNLGRLDYFDLSFEFAVYAVKDGLGKTEALFYLIRNSLAHGGFRICELDNEKFYVFENCLKGAIRGRAVIKESTLLRWIKVVKRGSVK